jgi:hypothetical protein
MEQAILRGVRATVSLTLLAVAGATFAGDGHRQHRAHEHGRATLQVVTEDEALVIELRVPAVHVVGFEHAPASDAERAAVRRAVARFERGDELLVPAPGAGCTLASHEVELGESRAGQDADPAHGHDRDEARGPGGAAHSELHARYDFRCASPQALDAIGLRLFEHLDDVEAIEAQVVTATLQTARRLDPGTASLRLVR